jgi:hypothetical protein
MQRPAGQKRQFYGYLPISFPYCRHGKRNTLETAWSNAHDLGKNIISNYKSRALNKEGDRTYFDWKQQIAGANLKEKSGNII